MTDKHDDPLARVEVRSMCKVHLADACNCLPEFIEDLVTLPAVRKAMVEWLLIGVCSSPCMHDGCLLLRNRADRLERGGGA